IFLRRSDRQDTDNGKIFPVSLAENGSSDPSPLSLSAVNVAGTITGAFYEVSDKPCTFCWVQSVI
ncbi:MAG: hypothetical protein OXG78_14975, partial [Chloroflexi bacterium]|nr:hypothetical protein [Chloroflexota bacterium]